MKKLKLLICIVICLFRVYPIFSQDSLITQKGFLVYNEIKTIMFVPTKTIDTVNPLISLNNSNFRIAFIIDDWYEVNKDKAQKFERLGCELLPPSDTDFRITKVIPVYLTYKIHFYRRDCDFYIKLHKEEHLLIIAKKKKLIKFKCDWGKNIKVKKIEYLDW